MQHLVESWQVQHVTAGFEPPGDNPGPGDGVLDSATVAPSALTITHVPGEGRLLAGRLSSIGKLGKGPFAYAWSRGHNDLHQGSGWVQAEEPVHHEAGGSWTVEVQRGLQYAVLQLKEGTSEEPSTW
jgi:hypothetical protein